MLRSGEGGFFIAFNVVGLLHAASWAVNTLVMERFFNAVEAAVTGRSPSSFAYLMLAAVVGVVLLQQIFNSAYNFIDAQISEKYHGLIYHVLHRKAMRVDPVAYENPAMLDDIEKARGGGEQALHILGMLSMTVSFYGFYFIAVGVCLYGLAPILDARHPHHLRTRALNVVARVRVFSKLEDIAAPERRRMESHERAIGDRAFYKETRTSGALVYFKRLYRESLALFNRASWRADRKTCLIELGLKMVSLCGYFGVLYILFSLLMSGSVSLGAFGAVLGSVTWFIMIMDEMVARNMGQMATALGKARNFMRFLDLPERSGSATLRDGAEIVLRGVDLTIEVGETVAIVGENGVGKSTLVRLITGLYLPTEGSVTIGGNDTRDTAPTSLFEGVSAVMQAYQRYQLTLRENVMISDVTSAADITASIGRDDLALDAETFPDGADTVLSREFDGVDLSGGQWQRVALAHGFYRPHDLIVLDEPTAAIDPLDETRLYQQLAELSRGKTAVIVTHRLGSARIADRIIVMDGGRIDAIGTHDDLLVANGKYAAMFAAQARWYTND